MPWQAYLGDDQFPYGEGKTREAAIDDAVHWFEEACEYGEDPSFPDRQAFIDALSLTNPADTEY